MGRRDLARDRQYRGGFAGHEAALAWVREQLSGADRGYGVVSLDRSKTPTQ